MESEIDRAVLLGIEPHALALEQHDMPVIAGEFGERAIRCDIGDADPPLEKRAA